MTGKSEVRRGEYKGHAIIGIYERGRDKPVVSFGLRKALAILEHIDEIREWAESAPASVEEVEA